MKKIENLKLLLTKNSIQDQERSLNKDDSPLFQRGVWGGLKKLAMTTIAVFAIGLLANFLVETKDTNAGRQPGDFLNQDFWDNYSSTGNIIAALYGDGTPGSSPYNRFWTGGCNITNVIYTGIIPSAISANTIYVLNSGNYTISTPVIMSSCSALIGSGKVTITKNNTNATIRIGNTNVIIDNLRINGNNLGSLPGISLNNASQNTINNVEVWGAQNGIKIENSKNNNLNKIMSHDNSQYGIWITSEGNENYINNSQIYNQTGVDKAGIMLEGAKYNIINNSHIFNNDSGIRLQKQTNSNIPSNANTINNSQIYNNSKGIYIYENYAVENIINNCDIYNNLFGYVTLVRHITGSPAQILTIIDVPIQATYNSNIENLFDEFEGKLKNIKKNVVNASFYSQSTGLLESNVKPNNYINKSNFYNNNTGIYLHSKNAIYAGTDSSEAHLTYFGENKLFANNTDIVKVVDDNFTGTIKTGVDNLLGRNAGTLLLNTETMSQYWITNPVSSIGGKLINDFTNRSANRGIKPFLAINNQPIKYIIGKNISKQNELVKWIENGTNIYPISFGIQNLDYNIIDYIASVSSNLNSADQAIVDYYYGPSSEFISNRSGNNCSLGAFTVEYINNLTDFNNKLLSLSPGILGHTIYVLDNLTYDMASGSQISINDNCVAIVNQSSGATLRRTGPSQNPLIQVNGQENIILNNLNLNGNNASNHGILLEKIGSQSSNNNTINNVKSYSHRMNGIMLGVSASHNTIMNTQTWNNQQNGIEIYLGGQYNVINNSLSYNNHWYGLRFGNISKYNTINNGQFFNNGIGGIFADFTTEQNIINNVHTYNNTEYGINFKRSSGNNLNNVYTYNNKIGINMTDISCVNNKFNGDLMLFGNSSGNMMGTSGTDNFLSSEGGNGTLVWLPGTLQSGGDSMNCAWATNPRRINPVTDWFLNIGSGCVNTGRQTAWNPPNANNIDYMFGLGISKQISPVGYIGGSIGNLGNQFNANAYIGEINPIIWTHPGSIIIRSGNETDLALNINHEMNVTYNTGMINHNFDVALTLYPSSTNGHIQIKTAGTWNNIGTGMTGVNFSTLEGMRVVVTTPNEHYKNVSGTLYIGTSQYGYSTGYFNIRTIADQTPPSIIRSGNIYPGGVWHNQSNTWQAIVTGAYATSGWAQYVTGEDACHTGLAVPALIYHGTLQNIVLNTNYATFNDKYVCIVAKDNVNNQYTTGLSNQIKISKVEFLDNIALGPVYYDIIDINFQNVQNFGYRWVNTGSECGTGLSGLSLINYSSPIVISNIGLNGKYLCAYAQDSTGSGKYLLSANKLNIIDYSHTVNFIDDVSASWVANDIISIFFSSSVLFSHKKYKRVDDATDCSNTIGMADYTGAINIAHQGLNGKHFCLYSREQISGIENYLISTNRLKVDSTNPTEPAITSPTSGQNIYWLIIKTLGASDGESGLAGFEYEIAQNATFLDVIASGTVYTISNEFSPIFNQNEANYAIRVRSVDNVGNKSVRSNIVDFNYKNIANFEFQNVNNAQLLTAYTSNEITMGGLGLNEVIKATVTNGVLLRNGNNLGTSGFVQNNDKLSIRMTSSATYSGVVQTELRIANRIVPWKITTAQTGTIINTGIIGTGIVSGCNVSPTELVSTQAILTSIVSMYTNPTQLHSFLLTMKSMLQDNIALAGSGNANNLECLLFLINQYIATNFNNQNSNIHKAPNCKEYTIVHNTGDNTYYSPNTIKQTKFGSRDELIKFLDSHNPGDCHINVYGNATSYDNTSPNRHIAPNGKVYRIESSNIGFSSPDFINVKLFATLAELRSFIDKNNPAIVVWSHNVDATFDPITHTAPNGKTYKIYKTNRGFMSYKLMKVQYFGTLEELKSYIDKNNK